jgi:hypothetical protein
VGNATGAAGYALSRLGKVELHGTKESSAGQSAYALNLLKNSRALNAWFCVEAATP